MKGYFAVLCENEQLTETTTIVKADNVKFPLHLKGFGRYILDANNTIIGKYCGGEKTEILDLMNERQSIYPVNEGIEITSRVWTENSKVGDNMYRRGDEVLYIKVNE